MYGQRLAPGFSVITCSPKLARTHVTGAFIGRSEFMHWRWFIAMVGAALAMPIYAQTAEHPVWKVGDTWMFHERVDSPVDEESDWSRRVVGSLSGGRYDVWNAKGDNLTFD